ncbi:MAG TPA: flagellar FlbD family protein [Candidatus Sulfotelmatobacter sp.]|nr:flagellar FlbD family protein [Candidatus Sulfotelmatobacter sp.]
MIRLTRLNNQPLVVNSDLIKCVENAPDTVLTLVTGEKIIVRESTEQVLQRVIEFRRAILAGLTLNPNEPNAATVAPAPPIEGSGST